MILPEHGKKSDVLSLLPPHSILLKADIKKKLKTTLHREFTTITCSPSLLKTQPTFWEETNIVAAPGSGVIDPGSASYRKKDSSQDDLRGPQFLPGIFPGLSHHIPSTSYLLIVFPSK